MDIKKILDFEVSIKKRLLLLVLFIGVLTTTDLIVKEIVCRNIKNNKEITVIKNFWYFGYVENDDIGLSALRGVTQGLDKNVKRIIMICLQSFGCIVALIFYCYLKKIKYFIPLILIICGGLGNLIDRIIRGYVVDYIMWFFNFIPLRFFNPFPIFNLADVYAFIGGFLLFMMLLIFHKEVKDNKF